MKNFLYFALFSFLTLFNYANLFSQAPGITCASAVTLTSPAVGGSITTGSRTTCGSANNFAAGFSSVSTLYGGGEDGVYSMVVPAGGGNYTFSFPASGAAYKILSIHSACPPTTANTLGGFTTGSGTSGTWTGNLSAGTVFIIIDTWPNPTCGIFTLNITRNALPTPPTNDACSNATSLPCGTSSLAGTTVNSVSETAPLGNASNFGVWYSFVGDGQSTTITSTTTFDHELDIMTGASCGLFAIVSAVDASIGTETYTFTTVNGQQYYIYVAHYLPGSTTTGTFTISRSCAAPVLPPANDLVCNATTILCGSTTSGTTVNATTTGTYEGVTTCGVSQTMPAVWYKIVGNGQVMSASLCGTVWDSKISVFSGATCTALTCLGGIDDNGPSCLGTSASYQWNSVNGTTYWIKVYGYSTNVAFSLSLTCVTPPTPPANDDCANATSINLQCPGSTTSTSGTTIGASEDVILDPSCDGGDIRDVWYSFNTGNNTQVSITATLGTATWIGVEIYTSCGTLATGLSTICDYNLLSPNPTVITGFLMNTTYRLRIFTNATYDTPGTFSIYLNTISNSSTLSSVSGTDNQTICLNNSITSITYTTTGATGATFTGLPTGVTGSWSNNIITISGTPTVSGTFNYIVTLTGGCGTVTSTGTITINPLVSTITSISGNSTIIAGTTENYSIPSDPNATSYQWDYKESSGGSWITNISSTTSASINWSLTTTSGAEVLVTVSNSCGSQSKNLTIYVDGALPIELLSFDGSVINSRNVLLEWSTASEKNNDYFIIERSVDGYNWLQIKNIDATGNSNTQINYTTIDNSAPRAIVYYKLSQVDFDGNSEKFDPISVNLTLDEKNCDYKFYDLNGKLIDINLVSPGVYLKSCDGETIKIWKY